MNLLNLQKIFYTFTGFQIIYNFFYYGNYITSSPLNNSWTNLILNFIPLPYGVIFAFLSLLGVISSLALSVRPGRKKLRILIFLILLFLIPLYFSSTGRLYRNNFLHIYLSFFMIFFNSDEKRNRFVLDIIQVTILLPYIISGIWKIESIIHLDDIKQVSNYVAVSITKNSIHTLSPINFFGEWIKSMPSSVQLLVTLSSIIFELILLIPIYMKKYRLMAGIGIVLFHFGTYLLMDIIFFPNPFLVLLFLVYGEKCRKPCVQ